MSPKQYSSLVFALVIVFVLMASTYTPSSATAENTPSTKNIATPSISLRQNLPNAKPESLANEKWEALKAKQEDLQQIRKEKQEKLQQTLDELKTMRASAKAEAKEKACELVTKRLSEVSARYEKNHQGHVERYKQLTQRLQSVVTRLKTSGQNTTTLETSIRKLDEKIRNVASEHNKYLELLKKARELSCATSETSYRQAVEEARAQLLKVRAAILEVREYYRSNVREEIIKLRANRPSASPRATNSSATTSSSQASASPTLATSASPRSSAQ